MSTHRHRTVTTADGVDLHVVEAGDPAAPPLVLVHGFAGSSQVWRRQLDDPSLTERFRVIAPDLRGHGASTQDLHPEQLGADDMDGNARIWSHDLDAVRDGLDAPVLVGWSFGGAVVQSHIHAHGGIGDAAAVVFVSSPTTLGPAPDGDPAQGLVPPAAVGALVGTAKGDTTSFKRRVLARGDDDATIDAADLDELDAIAALCPPATRSAMLGYTYDFRPGLAALPEEQRARMTTLVAEEDELFTGDAMHQVWEQAGVRTVSVPGEGHALVMRDPARFAELLLAALPTSTAGR
jgi:pimeloyl-ACP methyl ester carboxylesterase